MSWMEPINLKKWIEEHRELLKPPVGNQVVWKDREFIIMVVGGPNSRKDFHVNEGEEFFYQIEGDIKVRVMLEDGPKDIKISEGEIFLLPPNVPHSPIRPADTVGLVVERQRNKDERDGFQWYCEKCNNKLYEEKIFLTDIVTQLPVVFEKFYSDVKNRTCSKCGEVLPDRKL